MQFYYLKVGLSSLNASTKVHLAIEAEGLNPGVESSSYSVSAYSVKKTSETAFLATCF